MFKLTITVSILGLCLANQHIRILSQSNEIHPDGSYQWSYQTENGITAQELGKQRGSGPDAVLEVQGDYSYTSPEGKQVVMSYVADDSGFHPSGDLPTPPPIPLAIQKSLAWNAAHPEEDREDLVVRIGQQRRY